MLALPSRILLVLGLLAVPALASAQNPSRVTLENSETLFSVLAAINSCGYDQDLAASDPLRARVRERVARNAQASPEAVAAHRQLCQFYRDHQQGDASHDLAQYLSLALYLGPPPDFPTLVKAADLPPDVSYVLGFLPLLTRFYQSVNLAQVWKENRIPYEAQVERLHDPVSAVLARTDLYLKLPLSAYLDRKFLILIDPLLPPSQVNARNYGSDYFLVASPAGGQTFLDNVRHSYLHYVLDPLTLKQPSTMKRLTPLLLLVKTAPIDDSFKNDISLLVTESLIRAIEARADNPMPPEKKRSKEVEETVTAERERRVEQSVKEGYLLTRYFHEQFDEFEKSPVGLRDAYPGFLYLIDVRRETQRAEQVVFAPRAAPEVLRASNPSTSPLVDLAEQRLAAGDAAGAQKLAQRAMEEKQDVPRALFVLARAATLQRDVNGARVYFARTLEVAREPRIVAWSHIYLGRIFDLEDNREAAVGHYRAALGAGDIPAETRAAAQRGLEQPYQPPARREE